MAQSFDSATFIHTGIARNTVENYLYMYNDFLVTVFLEEEPLKQGHKLYKQIFPLSYSHSSGY
jgi:hypothetical protein